MNVYCLSYLNNMNDKYTFCTVKKESTFTQPGKENLQYKVMFGKQSFGSNRRLTRSRSGSDMKDLEPPILCSEASL